MGVAHDYTGGVTQVLVHVSIWNSGLLSHSQILSKWKQPSQLGFACCSTGAGCPQLCQRADEPQHEPHFGGFLLLCLTRSWAGIGAPAKKSHLFAWLVETKGTPKKRKSKMGQPILGK